MPAGIPNEAWRDFEFTVFAVDPAASNTVYAGTRAHGVYQSSDGGHTCGRSQEPGIGRREPVRAGRLAG